MNKLTSEIILNPICFKNNIEGFNLPIQNLKTFPKDEILIKVEDTEHYHFSLLQHLSSKRFNVALINPKTKDLNLRLSGKITKNDKLNTLNICDLLCSNKLEKSYRITMIGKFDLYEQTQLN